MECEALVEQVTNFGNSFSTETELDSEVEVFPLDSDNEITAEEDVHSGAWGNQRNVFYDGNFDDSDSDNLEQEEASLTQQKIYSSMKESDFGSHWLNAIDEEQSQHLSGHISSEDLVLVREGPSLEKIIKSFQRGVVWLLDYGFQACNAAQFTPEGNAYIQWKLHLMFCYCANLLYYLQLKMNGLDNGNHPVIGQIIIFHELMIQLRDIDDMLECASTSSGFQYDGKKDIVSHLSKPLEYYQKLSKKGTSSTLPKLILNNEDQELEGGKRVITYEMARNKGLIPKRNKVQRNPRVKHRNKYKKAVIKRRSQVLPVVCELYKYGGETSGIRSKLARSVAIK